MPSCVARPLAAVRALWIMWPGCKEEIRGAGLADRNATFAQYEDKRIKGTIA